ncbi:hypothetical protein [Sporosarcina obsidiansis]|uniref:hypothetical protein n=1 Tax=Sporosarcina obsidiansis TaxID=2660748 RepID=UPI00129AD6E1|nr:hypothetical protein [Sporosarcina obsidiansis]
MTHLIIFIAASILSLIILVFFVRKLYIKELKRKGIYDNFYFKYQSVECPHDKKIKYSETTWKDHFTVKREIGGSVKKGLVEVGVARTQHRLFCEECGEKRWFAQANSTKETWQYVLIILKYMLLALLGFVVLANIFVTFGKWWF